jgi:hypothetical protein
MQLLIRRKSKKPTERERFCAAVRAAFASCAEQVQIVTAPGIDRAVLRCVRNGETITCDRIDDSTVYDHATCTWGGKARAEYLGELYASHAHKPNIGCWNLRGPLRPEYVTVYPECFRRGWLAISAAA